MTDPREEEVVKGALELPNADTRAAFLADACEGDEALRARIEARIRDCIAAGEFPQMPPTEIAGPAQAPPPVANTRIGPAGTRVATILTEKPGDTIDRYRLLEQIGEGGFGVVYVAEQREPVKRRVALKVIKLGMDTKQVVARFEAERQALAMMDHPNIARVFDAGSTDTGRPYFVMELVHGIPITRYCDENSLSVEKRLALFSQVCEAIQHAHQKGIIHRDIKPSNILVTAGDSAPAPKVIDFGIAKATRGGLTDQTVYTQFQQFIGTPAYASPEQVEMTSLDIDTRSDIYSLGVLLYELLTGRLPFDPETLVKAGLDEMRRIIREQQPPRPSTRLSTLAEADQSGVAQRRQSNPVKLSNLLRGDLDWIVMKALEKDRTRRYESASAFAQDIQRHLHSEPVVARPPSIIYLLQRLILRHKLAVAAGTAVLLSLLVGLGIASYAFVEERAASEKARAAGRDAERANKRTSEALRQSENARTQAEAAKAAESQEREKAQYESYLAKISLAATKIESQDYQSAEELLDSCPEQWRHFEWGRLKYLCRHDHLSLDAGKGQGVTVSLNIAGDRLLTTSVGSLTRIWDATNGKELASARGTTSSGRLMWSTFSPDQKRILVATASAWITIFDAATGKTISELTNLVARGSTWERPVYSPDGNRILMAHDFGRAYILDAATGKKLLTLPASETVNNYKGNRVPVVQVKACYLPDGTRVLTFTEDEAIRLWDANSGALLQSIRVKGSVRAMALSSDGKWLLTASQGAVAILWDLDALKESRSLEEGQTDPISVVAFSPDNSLLLTAAQNGKVRLWDRASGALKQVLVGHQDDIVSASFSRDGQRLLTASVDRAAIVWDVKSGNEIFRFKGHSAPLTSAAFSPDGNTAVTADQQGLVKVWHFDERHFATALVGAGRNAKVTSFTPDGGQLLTVSLTGPATLWDVVSGMRIPSLGSSHTNISAGAILPDGKHAILGGQNFKLKQIELENGGVLQSFGPTNSSRPFTQMFGTYSVVLSADGLRAVTVRGGDSITVWDTLTGQVIRRFADWTNRVQFVGLSGDGKKLVLSDSASTPAGSSGKDFSGNSNQQVPVFIVGVPTNRVWDLEAETEVGLVPTFMNGVKIIGGLKHVTFSPDNKRMLAVIYGIAGPAILWHTETGRQLRAYGDASVTEALPSPDFKRVCTGSRSGLAELWDLETGGLLVHFRGHAMSCEPTGFSPDGRRLLTASADGTSKLWDTTTGRELLSLKWSDAAFRLSAKSSTPQPQTFSTSDPITTRPFFSPSGRQIVASVMNTPFLLAAVDWEISRPNADEYFSRAIAKFESVQLTASVADLDMALSLNPKLARAYYYRALANSKLGKLDEEIADYTKYLALYPKDSDALHYLAHALSRKGDARGALAKFDAAVQISPKDAEILRCRAKARDALEDYDGALADVALILMLEPQSPTALAHRARLKQRKGDLPGALADFNKALSLNSGNSSILVDRGAARRAMGDLEGAFQDYELAVKIRPGLASAWNGRAIVALALDNQPEFARSLEELKKLSAGGNTIETSVRRQGDRERLVRIGKTLEGNSLTQGTDFLARGLYRLAQKKYDEAIDDLQQSIKLDSSLGARLAFQGLVEAAEAKGDWQLKLATQRQWADATPESSSALNAYAWSLLTVPDQKLRDAKAALALARKACSLDNKPDGVHLDTLALALSLNNAHAEALETQKKALAALPANYNAKKRSEYVERQAKYEANAKEKKK